MPAVAQMALLGAKGQSEVLIDRTLGTNIGDMTGNGGLAAAFDGNANQGAISSAVRASTIGYVGKTLTAAAVFSRALVHGSNNQGYSNTPGHTIVATMYGKQGTAPASGLDGTIIGQISFADTANESAGREISSTDLVTAWDHIWVLVSFAAGPSTVRVAELVLYELK